MTSSKQSSVDNNILSFQSSVKKFAELEVECMRKTYAVSILRFQICAFKINKNVYAKNICCFVFAVSFFYMDT